MTCGQQQTVNGEIVSAKCILNAKHTSPHTDGDKQWADSDDSPMDSNYDLAAKEASKPYSPAPARCVEKCANPDCQHDRTQHGTGTMASCCVVACSCCKFVTGAEVYTAEVLAVVCPVCKGVNRCLEPSLWGSKFIDKPHTARVGLAAQLKAPVYKAPTVYVEAPKSSCVGCSEQGLVECLYGGPCNRVKK